MGDIVSPAVTTTNGAPRKLLPDDQIDLKAHKVINAGAAEAGTDLTNKVQMDAAIAAAVAVVAARALVLERQALLVSQYGWGAEGAAPGGANTRLLSISIRQVNGAAPFAPARVVIEPFNGLAAIDASFNLTDGGLGAVAVAMDATSKRALFTTDANGDLEVLVTDTAVQTVKLAIGGGFGASVIDGTITDAVFA